MGQDTDKPVSAPRGDGYARTAITLHWAIAALVLSTIPIGWYGATFPGDRAQAATNLHKSIGIVILTLTLVRVGWRLTHPPSPMPAMTPMLRRIARTTHVLFYALLLILPLSGWWMSSAVPKDRHPFGFGFFDVPFLPVPRGWASAGPAHFVHTNLAWVMLALAVLHIAAALKHQFVDKDDVLARMLPRKA